MLVQGHVLHHLAYKTTVSKHLEMWETSVWGIKRCLIIALSRNLDA